MFCGTGSFSYVDEDHPRSPSATTPRSNSSRRNKNPYSARGLDKFSVVLAELEAMREKITAQAGSQATVVRFMHANSHWVPIIVKLRPSPEEGDEKKPPSKKLFKCPPARQRSEISKSEAAAAVAEVAPAKEKQAVVAEKRDQVVAAAGRKSFSSKDRVLQARWLCPSYGSMLVVAMILVCLALFGRTFAICCTSAWWYLLPSVRGDQRSGGRGRRYSNSMKKRSEFGRRASDKRLGGGGDGDRSPKQQLMSFIKRP